MLNENKESGRLQVPSGLDHWLISTKEIVFEGTDVGINISIKKYA